MRERHSDKSHRLLPRIADLFDFHDGGNGGPAVLGSFLVEGRVTGRFLISVPSLVGTLYLMIVGRDCSR